MTLHERITADTTLAAKGGDEVRRDTLRFLLASLHNREIEKRGKGDKELLTDEDVASVVEREVKKRKEALEFFEKGNRPEQAAKEKAELIVLGCYLPAALPEAEVDALVDEAIRTTGAQSVKDIGKVMGAVMKAAKGARVDASLVGAKVKARLSAQVGLVG
ncbi:MAG: GatB/YqeY domain-containing protein [Candidatus Brennerbacteria bacterium]